MDEHALTTMRDSQPGGARAEPLLDANRVKKAQELAGLAGWISTSCRPDGYFAYVALSQHLANGLTATVWDAVLRWVSYLANTPDIKLTYRAASAGADWEMFADSPLFNNGNGSSFGGYVARFPGSGVFAWKSFVPRKLSLSSVGAETTMAAYAVHFALGQRMLAREIGRAPAGPTVVHTGNLATLQGTAMENVPVKQRYLAAQRAILRQVCTEEKIVRFLKVATDDNPADLFTKPLEGDQFVKLRAIIMGLSAAIGPPTPALPISQGAPKVDWVHFVKGLEADETSSSYELRRGSLPSEDLRSTAENAGDMHRKHAVGYDLSAAGYDLPSQRSPPIAVETAGSSQHQSSLV
jgi:hypothetical protein